MVNKMFRKSSEMNLLCLDPMEFFYDTQFQLPKKGRVKTKHVPRNPTKEIDSVLKRTFFKNLPDTNCTSTSIDESSRRLICVTGQRLVRQFVCDTLYHVEEKHPYPNRSGTQTRPRAILWLRHLRTTFLIGLL